MSSQKICLVPECASAAKSLGYCDKHYARVRRYGDPHKTTHAPLGDAPAFVAKALASETDDCIIWPYNKAPNGYGKFGTLKKQQTVHRYVCEATNGPPPTDKHHAAHRCGVRLCCNPRHIRWATPTENIREKRDHGTMTCGERHPDAKLTEADVLEMRRLSATVSGAELGRMFGVTKQSALAVIKRKTWAHI